MTERIMTASTVSDNPYIAAMISAARRGDIRASATCLYFVGQALEKQQPPDPAFAQYVGDCLTRTAVTAIASMRTAAKTTTDKRARDVARDLGLIATRPGPRTSRFEPLSHWFYLASSVADFHQQKCPLTRNEGGAFFRAAKAAGCSPGTAEAAYRKLKKRDHLHDPAMQKSVLMFAKTLEKLRRERN